MNTLRRSNLFRAAGLCLMTCAMVAQAEVIEIPVKAASGFESDRVLAMAELDFGGAVALSGLRFIDADNGDVPFFFVPMPGQGYRGRLYWMWDRTPPFRDIHFRVRARVGEWRASPVGDAGIGVIVKAEKDLLQNSVFDQIEDGWPLGWRLRGSASLSEENAFYGRHTVRISARFDNDQYASGVLHSERVALAPGTPYRLRVRATVTERRETDLSRPYHQQQGIGVALCLRNAEGGLLPRISSFNTLAGQPDEKGPNRRLIIEAIGVTPPEVREGHVQIQPLGLDGTIYIDEVLLETWPKGHPHRVEVDGANPVKEQ